MEISKKIKTVTKSYTKKIKESSNVEATFVVVLDGTDCFIDGFGSETHLVMAANALLTAVLKQKLLLDDTEDEIVDP